MKLAFRPSRSALLAVGLFAAIVLVRVIFVSLYAESIPMWDEWDAEGDRLIKPWLEGHLELSHFIRPHNEHRVLFTRVLALTLFWLNGRQWDNLVGAYTNVLLYAGIATVIFTLLQRELSSNASRAVLFLAFVLSAALPFGYENTLVGFQSQFYLMTGFTVALIALASVGSDSYANCSLMVLLGILGLFTMASGLVAPLAAALVLTARALLRQVDVRRAAPAATLLVAIAVVGYRLVPVIPGHQQLKAPDLFAWLDALIVAACWPLTTGLLGALMLWSPTALLALKVLRTRAARPAELLALGLAAWVLIQCAAMAYSRGNGMTSPASRYTDILALGLSVNLWSALSLVSPSGEHRSFPSREASTATAVIFALAAAIGMWRRTPDDLRAVRERSYQSIEQTRRVRAFVRDDKPEHLQAPFLHIPYPDAGSLAGFLHDRTLRAVLPPSIRAPLFVGSSQAKGAFDAKTAGNGLVAHSCSLPACARGTGRWESSSLRTRFSYLEVAVFAGGRGKGLKLGLAPAGREGDPAELVDVRTHGRATRILSVPDDQGFRLLAADSAVDSWLAVSAPVEVSFLSMVARKVKVWARRHFRDPERLVRTSQYSTLELPIVPENNQARVLGNGESTTAHFAAPNAGLLEGVSLLIGNFRDTADGALVIRACVAGACQKGEARLTDSKDNDMLAVVLAEPLPVAAQQEVELRVSTDAATKPVALWLYPAKQGSACIVDASGTCGDRALRLALDYLD